MIGSPNRTTGRSPVRRFLFWLPEPLVATQRPIAVEGSHSRRSVIDLALEFQRRLDEGMVNTRADLARPFGISRARVTQVMNVLRLTPSALDLLCELAPHAPSWWTERRLRPVVLLPTEAQQVAAIRRLGPQPGGVPSRTRR